MNVVMRWPFWFALGLLGSVFWLVTNGAGTGSIALGG